MPQTTEANEGQSKDRVPVCTICASPYHYQTFCPYKPKQPITTRRKLNGIGKQGKRTATAVAKWKRTQKPSHEGYYTCYIGGDKIPYLVAEHPYSKARHPELRDTQKLEPVCSEHNRLKGSLDIDEFLEKYPQFKLTVKAEYLRKE